MKLQDYIHYYIGCDVIIDGKERGRLMGGHLIPNSVNQIYYDIQTGEMKDAEGDDFSMPYNDDPDDPEPRIKPILRKLGDYEVGELNEYQSLIGKTTDGVHSVLIHYDTPETFHWLLKKGFDLFGLIDAGLAIYSKTLK